MASRYPIRMLLGIVAIMTGAGASLAGGTPSMTTGTHDMAGHPPARQGPASSVVDNRLVVEFPPAFKRQELAHMRDHLESLQLITHYLAEGDYQAASDVANRRLTRGGMSAHDRHQAAHYMPRKMLAMGAAMHRAAGHFAIVAQDAAVSGDMPSTLRALAEVQNRCIACHRTYRMK